MLATLDQGYVFAHLVGRGCGPVLSEARFDEYGTNDVPFRTGQFSRFRWC